MRLAVIGGGIAGLAAAWEANGQAEVTIWEPGALGGKLRTSEFEGRLVDCGADAFLTRVPEAVALADEIGLGDDLVAPAAGHALVWRAGARHPLPDDLVLGVPRRLGPLLRSRLLGPMGVARAGLDLVLPATAWPEDISVHELIRRRFGAQVASRLVDPLVGSIHAGRTEELSAAATAPQLLAAARRSRSLMLGLRRPASGGKTPPAGGASPGGAGRSAQVDGPGGGPAPIFLAPRAGMQAVADRLATRLIEAGTVVVEEAVTGVRPCPEGGVEVSAGGTTERYDAVVLAVPAAAAALMLGDLAPAGLGSIPTASVALVTMEYAAADLVPPAGVSGILVSRSEGLLMTACSFASTKWPHWAAPGRVLLRVSTGREGDARFTGMDDETLVGRLDRELRLVGGATGDPSAWRVSRWADAFPQYRVGHLQAVDRIEAELQASAPGVRLAGASYRGAGVPACIGSGRRAATALVSEAS
jgi:protoporphyrinogen/coproporphyrinogen III oxidase